MPHDTGALGIEPTGDVQGYAGPELPNIGVEGDEPLPVGLTGMGL